MRNKAQTAMEYLMTYGWAILIIIVVIAALYSLGVFSVKTSVACSPCFSYFAFRDYDSTTQELYLRNSARSLNSLTIDLTSESGTGFLTKAAASGGLALDCSTTTCSAGIDIVVTGGTANPDCALANCNPGTDIAITLTVNTGDQTLSIDYDDADSTVTHTDTATIHTGN